MRRTFNSSPPHAGSNVRRTAAQLQPKTTPGMDGSGFCHGICLVCTCLMRIAAMGFIGFFEGIRW
ncbi:hypothetical protein [uncultured Bilophila sp.]|uniref:hypothetical protein n=1 Tax=uncultured Bilophila sp. TaxID=529385 RepID=UPI00266EBB37|nr:hypothetical protein [uncultured Bilophila sp.]